jgi:hypothetical protein
MTNLVERLRAFIKEDYAVERPQMRALCREAANEIERLKKQRVTYRKVLRDLNKAHRVLWKMVFLYYDQREKK